ncbi:phosphopantetheine-binding protein [Streptomyces sp. NBC_01481]|uniref:phosphopantetheine-binding protein n=1 Tax=unclassified Streptomyces TaxID=2593676 RepID=UPI002254C276|nr:phosphopantetheine-binding protein [Streptomyces sp. NBC_01481]MCX4582464.1 phosphopantetheine-binding protein [Streptomyces sp. NBC_01481]
MDITPTPTELDLRATVAPLLGLEPEAIEPDANLVVLGLSSLEIMRLVSRWRKNKIPVQFDELVAAPTLNGWLAHFASLAVPASTEPGVA